MNWPASDVRYAARTVAKSPGFTVMALTALTLGIGLTTAMFSIVRGSVLRGLPFERPEQLMQLNRSRPAVSDDRLGVSLYDFHDWRGQQTSFEDIALWGRETVVLSGVDGNAGRYSGAVVTPNLFGLLRVRPALGRVFDDGDALPDAAAVMIIGHDVWRNRFGHDPDIIGRTVTANGRVTTVVGVMPDGFGFPVTESVWCPLQEDPYDYERGSDPEYRGFGRLADGVSQSQALLELTDIAGRLGVRYPESNLGMKPRIAPFIEDVMGEQIMALGASMLFAVFGVLLVACANVANLLLARATARAKEVAIRIALGARRARVIWMLFAEALVIASGGAVLGLGVAQIAISFFNDMAHNAPTVPFWLDVRLDGTVLVFVLGVTVLASVVSGVFPALQASGADIENILKDESRGATSLRVGRFTRGLVVAEVALSCALLVGAGLMIRTITNVRSIDDGFATRQVLTSRVALSVDVFDTREKQLAWFAELLRRLDGEPGVDALALTSAFPGVGAPEEPFALRDVFYATEDEYPTTRYAVVGRGYFDVFGTGVIEGRDFSRADTEHTLPVAIVNEAFVRRFTGGGEMVGRQLRLGSADAHEPWRTVVGVAPDLGMRARRAGGLIGDDPSGVYVPFAQSPRADMGLVIRARGEPLLLSGTIREARNAIGPDQPIYAVDTLDDAVASQNVLYDVIGSVFMTFGVVALLLAAVGLYGVISFSVGNRRHEMGLRMALGAQGRSVLAMILRQGVAQLAVGVGIGMTLAAALARTIEASLFGVEPWDLGVFAAVVTTLVGTGLLACVVPALRATKVDPTVALRSE